MSFSLESFLGDWVELAFVPSWFEWALTRYGLTTAQYSRIDSERVRVVNTTVVWGIPFRAEGTAFVRGKGEFHVNFVIGGMAADGPVNYRICALDKNYRWAVVEGGPHSPNVWVLVRPRVILDSSDCHSIKEALGGRTENLYFHTNPECAQNSQLLRTAVCLR